MLMIEVGLLLIFNDVEAMTRELLLVDICLVEVRFSICPFDESVGQGASSCEEIVDELHLIR